MQYNGVKADNTDNTVLLKNGPLASQRRVMYDVPNAHSNQSAVPTLDHLASAKLELEGLSTVQ